MAFDLNKLKNRQNSYDTVYLSILKGYLDSEEFEDMLQRVLEIEIDNGSRIAQIALIVEKTPMSYINLRLASKDATLKYDIGEESTNKIGDINRYTTAIEEKLTSLRLKYSTEFPFQLTFDNLKVGSPEKYIFTIKLDFEE